MMEWSEAQRKGCWRPTKTHSGKTSLGGGFEVEGREHMPNDEKTAPRTLWGIHIDFEIKPKVAVRCAHSQKSGGTVSGAVREGRSGPETAKR